MKKILLIAAAALSCLPAFANGNNAALLVCSTLPFSSDKQACLSVVTRGNFDADGVNVCSTLPYSSDKISCLEAIRNKLYSGPAASVCSTIPFSSDKISCLKVIANKAYDSRVLSICSSIPYSSDKVNCLATNGSPIVVPPAPGPMPPLPPHHGTPSRSCRAVVETIDRACGLSYTEREFLASKAQICDSAKSSTGKTVVQVLLKRGAKSMLAVNTLGEGRCKIQQINLLGLSGASDLNTVKGIRHSDRVFVLLNDGRLFYMDMNHRVYEVMNSKGRPYNVERIVDLGNETIELFNRGGGATRLTFDQIDQRRREGKIEEIKVVELELGRLHLQLGW